MFRYFGSKASTAQGVADLALEGLHSATVADAFGGIGNIGAAFKRRNCQVTTCDLLDVPNAFQHTRLVCQRIPHFGKVREELQLDSIDSVLAALNGTSRASSWFVREYSEQRNFFTAGNAVRIGSTWATLCRWNKRGLLSENERKYLIASFINSVDACANTAGTYYAYLKTWHRKALRPFEMSFFPIETGFKAGQALKGDALECLRGKSFDVLYLDPPYNARDYSRYYHLPETLAGLRPLKIDIESKAGQPFVRADKGPAIRKAMHLSYLTELISSVKWKRLVVQYADGAFIQIPQLKEALACQGRLKSYEVSALGYMSKNGTRQHKQHVFVIDA
ncbi:DNA adenine methylase [Herbaspirillum frisingense]|uniref:DNA adenine methylase n=1 Tax=Herbaspirillum frisingense TaxID=92645 RepID=UPI0009DB6C56|nr:DNA adenine methylase [Herbaspirillum frisingense]